MTVVLSSLFFEFIVYLFIFIFGCAGSLLLCTGFILLQKRGLLFFVVPWLLIVVASLVEHRL